MKSPHQISAGFKLFFILRMIEERRVVLVNKQYKR